MRTMTMTESDEALLKEIRLVNKIAKAVANPPKVCVIGTRHDGGKGHFTLIVRPPLIDPHLRQQWLDSEGEIESIDIKIDFDVPEKEAIAKAKARLIKKIASMQAKIDREHKEYMNEPLPNGIKSFSLKV